MLYLFYIPAALLIIQGVFSLIEGLQFLSFIRRSLTASDPPYTPVAAVIAPCKGLDAALEENLAALFEQDYPDYEIIFVIASPADPARAVIERAISLHPKAAARLVIAGSSDARGEKVNNLLCAIERVSPRSEVLVFVDSDARVHAGWLRSLIAPLRERQIGATTGYRWYLPDRGGLAPALLSAWNGSVATTLGDHDRNFAWGGSTAILKETFRKTGVDKRWSAAVSDDYALTRAMKDAGLRIRFVPRCLLVSREDPTLASLVEFTTRQVIITRVYRPAAWWVGLVSHVLFNAVFFGGVSLVAAGALASAVALPSMLLGLIYLLGSLKGLLRLMAAREAIPRSRASITRLWWVFCLLWPLVSAVFLYNFLASAMTRRIKWRGVLYELRSDKETVVIR